MTAQKPITNTRKRLFIIASSIFLVIGIIYFIYWWFFLSHYESTEDAYVQGNLIQVSAQINGNIRNIYTDNTYLVKSGEALISLDDTDAQLAYEKAKTQLAQAVRQVSGLYANTQALKAQLDVQKTNADRAKAILTEAHANYQRRKELLNQGAISTEEFTQSQTNLQTAKSQYDAAQAGIQAAVEQYKSSQVLTQGTTISQHPNVQQAITAVRDAYINLQRTQIVAPTSGQISKRSAQVGQRVAPGTPLLTIVPLNQVWVDANFKENQLRHMRVGQPVTLTADIYEDSIKFRGTVAGISAGTGGAFSLLPAQNASGNWIKVVQRVPVRIILNPDDVKKFPLRVGLSMTATVDIANRNGPVLGSLSGKKVQEGTQSGDYDLSAVNQSIDEIIQKNVAN